MQENGTNKFGERSCPHTHDFILAEQWSNSMAEIQLLLELIKRQMLTSTNYLQRAVLRMFRAFNPENPLQKCFI